MESRRANREDPSQCTKIHDCDNALGDNIATDTDSEEGNSRTDNLQGQNVDEITSDSANRLPSGHRLAQHRTLPQETIATYDTQPSGTRANVNNVIRFPPCAPASTPRSPSPRRLSSEHTAAHDAVTACATVSSVPSSSRSRRSSRRCSRRLSRVPRRSKPVLVKEGSFSGVGTREWTVTQAKADFGRS